MSLSPRKHLFRLVAEERKLQEIFSDFCLSIDGFATTVPETIDHAKQETAQMFLAVTASSEAHFLRHLTSIGFYADEM